MLQAHGVEGTPSTPPTQREGTDMGMTSLRWLLLIMLAWLIVETGVASPVLEILDDRELATIYATGLNIQIDLDFDLTTPEPNTLFIDREKLDALQAFANASKERTSLLNGTSGGTFDIDGINLSNFQSIVNNNITISDNALQHAQSLLNIIALGDVAVGLNLTIIVNPGDTPFTVTQTNINWSDLLSSITPTPSALLTR